MQEETPLINFFENDEKKREKLKPNWLPQDLTDLPEKLLTIESEFKTLYDLVPGFVASMKENLTDMVKRIVSIADASIKATTKDNDMTWYKFLQIIQLRRDVILYEDEYLKYYQKFAINPKGFSNNGNDYNGQRVHFYYDYPYDAQAGYWENILKPYIPDVLYEHLSKIRDSDKSFYSSFNNPQKPRRFTPTELNVLSVLFKDKTFRWDCDRTLKNVVEGSFHKKVVMKLYHLEDLGDIYWSDRCFKINGEDLHHIMQEWIHNVFSFISAMNNSNYNPWTYKKVLNNLAYEPWACNCHKCYNCRNAESDSDDE